jgi:hypothetical protein
LLNTKVTRADALDVFSQRFATHRGDFEIAHRPLPDARPAGRG